jgi:hypothetical protein
VKLRDGYLSQLSSHSRQNAWRPLSVGLQVIVGEDGKTTSLVQYGDESYQTTMQGISLPNHSLVRAMDIQLVSDELSVARNLFEFQGCE